MPAAIRIELGAAVILNASLACLILSIASGAIVLCKELKELSEALLTAIAGIGFSVACLLTLTVWLTVISMHEQII